MSTDPMSWRCPACQAPLHHDGDRSAADQIYRCHGCRLELVFEARTGRLTPATSPTPLPRDPRTRRTSAG
jgi:hypothetical protein